MKEMICAFLVWVCVMLTILVGSFCLSFGWYQAREVVLLNSNMELLSHISIVKG